MSQRDVLPWHLYSHLTHHGKQADDITLADQVAFDCDLRYNIEVQRDTNLVSWGKSQITTRCELVN